MFAGYDEGAMIITPQARRRIDSAVRGLPDARSQERWSAWTRRTAPNFVQDGIPYDIAEIALEALTAAERRIEARLSAPGVHDDSEADLLNDLGFIRSVEALLRAEGVGR